MRRPAASAASAIASSTRNSLTGQSGIVASTAGPSDEQVTITASAPASTADQT